MKNTLGYDDALDVFGVHCIGGIVGALGTGILVGPCLGGVGIADYTNVTGNDRRQPTRWARSSLRSSTPSCSTLIWSGVGFADPYKVVDLIVGLRVRSTPKREGLDIAEHGERAYNTEAEGAARSPPRAAQRGRSSKAPPFCLRARKDRQVKAALTRTF